MPLRVRWAGERCSVCDADTDYDFDQLVTCDLCGITVHQVCVWVLPCLCWLYLVAVRRCLRVIAWLRVSGALGPSAILWDRPPSTTAPLLR
jgi:hypothetical protein